MKSVHMIDGAAGTRVFRVRPLQSGINPTGKLELANGTGEDATQHSGEAAKNPASILSERALRGGSGFINGKHVCVCFSEAPIGKLSQILACKDHFALCGGRRFEL